ncbi:EscU/YscU/HrcU family type III secretion system export apparatus switch protein [Shigella sonnei]
MAELPITAMGNAMDSGRAMRAAGGAWCHSNGGSDVFFQIFSHLKKLRMSRQDIRDEFKQSEGDPHVKGGSLSDAVSGRTASDDGRCAESGCHCQ